MAGRVRPAGQVFDTCGLDTNFCWDVRLSEIITSKSVKQFIHTVQLQDISAMGLVPLLLFEVYTYENAKYLLPQCSTLEKKKKKDILEKCVNGHYSLLHF